MSYTYHLEKELVQLSDGGGGDSSNYVFSINSVYISYYIQRYAWAPSSLSLTNCRARLESPILGLSNATNMRQITIFKYGGCAANPPPPPSQI